MSIELDFSELADWDKDFLGYINRRFPAKAKLLMGRAGTRFKTKLKQAYRKEPGLKKKTGNLLAGVDKGRPYVYKGDEYQVRAYNKAPHAHLIEHGHEMYTHDKRKIEGKRTRKYNIAGKTALAFDIEFNKLCEKFVDDMLKRGIY